MSDEHEDEHSDEHREHSNISLAFLITCSAGLAAFIGCFAIFCINKETMSLIPISLSFSSGVIIYLLFMQLLPESIKQFNLASNEENEALAHFKATICIIAGLIIMTLLEFTMKKFGLHSHQIQPDIVHKDGNSESEGNNIQEIRNTKSEIRRINLKHLAFTISGAMILHHLPEGIATFVSLQHKLEFGILVAFSLMIHDIPNGICISIPTYLATGNKWFPFILCIGVAIAYPIGAFIGWIIIEIASESFIQTFIAALFGITAGIMLYIAFVELLPTAILSAHRIMSLSTNSQNIFIWCNTLLFLGFLVMDISAIVLLETDAHSY